MVFLLWADLAAQSNREGWPAERLLHTLLVSVSLQAVTLDLSNGSVDPFNLSPGCRACRCRVIGFFLH